jgi:hypothetical protein
MTREKDLDEKKKDNIIAWTTFYRRNVHYFVKHYLGIELHLYQSFWIFLMGITDTFVCIASRASAKSWLIGVFSIARAILYPNSLIIIVASTKEQAGNIVSEKIKGLYNSHPNVQREIKKITDSLNKYEVEFWNGSTIRVVASRDSSRGKRSTFTIYEEFRLIDKAIVDEVIRPFSFIRQPPYLKNPEYSHLKEESKEIFISSAYHKGSGFWWYEETIKTIKMMLNGGNVGFLAFDYLIVVKHGIKTMNQILKDKEKMDEITFSQEYENIPYSEGSSAYFKLNMFIKNRILKRAFYPVRNEDFDSKKFHTCLPKQKNEIRFISVDLAARAGTQNDATIMTCFKLVPTNKGYERNVLYIESHAGKNTVLQTLRLKQLWFDFQADYFVIDLAQMGISIYDNLGTVTIDDERGIEYPAFTVMQHKSIEEKTYNELFERTIGLDASPIIYPIVASARSNSEIAVELKDSLQKKMIHFLIEENKADDIMTETEKDYLNAENSEMKARLLHPYLETSLMINECINLSMTIVSGNIKLSEGGGRKDKYTSLSYGNHFASLLDNDLLKEMGGDSLEDWLNSTGFF